MPKRKVKKMNREPYENFRVNTDAQGVTTVTLNVPGRAMNVLDRDVMSELDQIVRDIETSDDTRLVVFRSGKESGFLAGADVSVIASIDSAAEAGRLIEAGQLLFQRIEWLPMPTVVAIDGPCLGGGLEWALACDYRVARDSEATKIGLPEIKLGLIPGWGGTQRLPKIVGLSSALKMILTGRHVAASESHKIGLVDRLISPDHWEEGVKRYGDDVLRGTLSRTSSQTWWQRWIDRTSLGRKLVLLQTQRSVEGKAGSYPALRSAINAVKAGFDPGIAGYATERTEFVSLLATPTCRNLLELFFARERARNLRTWTSGVRHAAHDHPIQRVGVIGAGAMGAGIGQLAVTRGFEVVLKEVSPEAAQAGRHRVEKLVESLAKRKRWDGKQVADLLRRVTITCEQTPLSDCDLIIEAAVEREDIKVDIFRMLDQVAPQQSILASNTSSLSIAAMADATTRPAKVAGLHFFNPVHRMELVEVVRAGQTDDETVARLVAFVRALGKTPIVTADSAGFLVNRVLFPYLGEAVLLAGETGDIRNIDRQIRKFGMPMGPLELIDQVGLDVALHVSGSLRNVLPELDQVTEQLENMVQQGHLGKKSGIGFYHYKKGRRGDPATLPEFKPPITSVAEPVWLEDGLTLTQRRLVYPMLIEAIRCLEQRVVDRAWAIDLAMVLGTGFAPHHGGPLRLVDAIGRETLFGNLQRMQSAFGSRFAPPQGLCERGGAARPFVSTEPTWPSGQASST